MQRRSGIAGIGSALLDVLYSDADFSSPVFQRYRSQRAGDGGLTPGQLVFTEAIERFSGATVDEIVGSICNGEPTATNLGGPAIVALVHAAQVLAPAKLPVRFFGVRGDDTFGDRLAAMVAQTPVSTKDYRRRPGPSPSTRVLSDPDANNGEGERLFINTIGVADHLRVRDIPAEFFDYDVAFFGGTAVIPMLHRELGLALHSSRIRSQLTVVATVYDFLNESRAPNELWPLGEGQRDYPLIDLVIVDGEEARRLTGTVEPVSAVRQFLAWGAGAAIVTHGSEPVTFAGSNKGRFRPVSPTTLPVSDEVRRRAAGVDPRSRDTTGCGDNFAGGVVAEIARQRASRPDAPLDLRGAVIEGICAGAAAWFQLGGTFIEPRPGATLARLAPFREAYLRQICK